MKKHGIKLFAGTAAVGILTLTAAFFAVRYFMVGNEYASCRRGMLSRSYEMLISLLVSYRERQGAETAERISFCAAYLPLSEGSELAVQRFCADISASETDRAAGERAEKYCGELLVLLSCSRTAALSGNMPEFPAYPEADAAPASVLPEKYDDGGRGDARKAADALLGSPARLREYSYSADGVTVFGFRTASSYAEYCSATGRLIRAVICRRSAAYGVPEEADIIPAAREFSKKNGYQPSGDPVVSFLGGIYTAEFPCGDFNVTVGVSGGGEVCLFLAVPCGERG